MIAIAINEGTAIVAKRLANVLGSTGMIISGLFWLIIFIGRASYDGPTFLFAFALGWIPAAIGFACAYVLDPDLLKPKNQRPN